MAVSFMPNELGPDATLSVQIAWGADLTDTDGSGWSWSDVTADVRYGNKVTVKVGRADEASDTQPANCRFTLDNTNGDYSLGGQAANWPNVRRNTPVRVRVDPDGSGEVTVFQGYVDGFNPGWDQSGRDAVVHVSASGVLRRLAQNNAPVLSAIRRGILSLGADMVAYWPCEDGKLATEITSGIEGQPNLAFTGEPKFATLDSFPSSKPLPLLNASRWYAFLNPHVATGETQVRFLIDVPEDGTDTNEYPIMGMGFTGGTITVWELLLQTGGSVVVKAWNHGTVLLNSTIGFALNGRRGQLGFQLTQNGANIDYDVDFLELNGGSSGATGTLASRTVGSVWEVVVNNQSGHADVGFGHLTLEKDITAETVLQDQLDAFNVEFCNTRLNRLSDENDLPVDIIFGTADVATFADVMGPQTVDTLLALVRSCELAEGGILWDGSDTGLHYRERRAIENQSPAVTLRAVDLLAGGPVFDDQSILNKVVAKRSQGGDATFEDVDGDLGTATIGIYDGQVTINSEADNAMRYYAGWLVHRGTIDGYRYPELTVDVKAVPWVAAALLDVLPGTRVDVTGFDDALSQHPAGTVELWVQGYTHTFTSDTWTTALNAAPFRTWRIVVLADDTGDTDENLLHLDTDGSTLSDPAAIGATSLIVETTSGPLWTTTADDFPFDIEVGGIRVTVTSIAAPSGQFQGFNVTGSTVTKALTAGMSVRVWQPPALGL